MIGLLENSTGQVAFSKSKEQCTDVETTSIQRTAIRSRGRAIPFRGFSPVLRSCKCMGPFEMSLNVRLTAGVLIGLYGVATLLWQKRELGVVR